MSELGTSCWKTGGMIHSTPRENEQNIGDFLEIIEPQTTSEASRGTPPPVPSQSFRWPAAYYSNPLGEVAPLFPKWVPIGCGSIAGVVLVLLFAGGAIAMNGGAAGGGILDLVLGTVQDEVKPLETKDVSPAQRAAFEKAMSDLRARARSGNVELPKLQQMLEKLQAAVVDQKVTPQELDQLTATARDLAQPRKPLPRKQ
jgi:hypothetical protein